MKDKDTTIQELKDVMQKFLKEREWEKHQTPRNTASSIIIEAAELLEHFQWEDSQEKDKQEIARELADVVAYVLSFAIATDIDITEAFEEKMQRNAEKYPAEKFKGKAGLEEYYEAKNQQRNKKQKRS